MSQPEVFLGQDLMRQAIAEQSLRVFEDPAGVMHDLKRPLLERNDAFTAIRFGLAGLVMRAWEPTIVEPCEAYSFGGGTIDYRFKGDFFPSHDSEIIDTRNSPHLLPETIDSQGEYALDTVRRSLQQSMERVLAAPEQYTAGNVSVSQTLQGIRDYVTQARELGLTLVPDVFSRGSEFIEDFYRANTQQEIDIDGLADTARNPVRFTSAAITYLMKSSVLSGWQRQEDNYAFNAQFVEGYQPEQTQAMLRDIVFHAARASQRNDTNRTVVAAESIRREFSIQANRVGRPEVHWPTKHNLPLARLQEGQEPPSEKPVSNRRRNKCPIGYTEKAGDPMPIRNIYKAMITYLVDAGLHEPINFVAPKIIGVSFRVVS